MSKEKKKSKIPDFKTREEEAEFWDTHDAADFQDEFHTVEVEFAENLGGEASTDKPGSGIRDLTIEEIFGAVKSPFDRPLTDEELEELINQASEDHAVARWERVRRESD